MGSLESEHIQSETKRCGKREVSGNPANQRGEKRASRKLSVERRKPQGLKLANADVPPRRSPRPITQKTPGQEGNSRGGVAL